VPPTAATAAARSSVTSGTSEVGADSLRSSGAGTGQRYRFVRRDAVPPCRTPTRPWDGSRSRSPGVGDGSAGGIGEDGRVSASREVLTWELFGTASRELAVAVASDGYRPDLILSIARGGLFVAGALGYALDVKNLHVMNIEFYTGVDQRLEMPVMLPPTPSAVDLSGARVLVADDVADTGATLRLVRDFCADHVADVRCAVVYEKPRSAVKCEYVWRRTDRWIDFPWSADPPVVSRDRP
jgi:hypoxanthine phosphoribosyltransferase